MTLRFSRLDRPSIRRLEPGSKITEHGITAERLPSGDARYSVNIMVDGQRIHRVIGLESDGVTRSQCEEFIQAKRTEAREERLSLPKGRKTHLSFTRAADDYLAKLEESDGKNIERKRAQLEAHLKPFFWSQRLDKITTFTIDRYRNRRKKEDASDSTINRELAAVSHLFTKAVEWNWIKARPCMVKKAKEPDSHRNTLSDKQTDALFRAAIADADTDLWLFVAIALNTAMRHSEILKMRWENLDFERNRLFIPQAKAGMREQPITPELAAILSKEREGRGDQMGWIFPSLIKESLYGHRLRMSLPFRRAVKAAGMDAKLVTPHVLRHTAITNLVKAGVDLPTIQRISGHKTLAMVLRYTHVHGSHIDQGIKAIGRGLPEPSPNKTADTVTQELHQAPKRSA